MKTLTITIKIQMWAVWVMIAGLGIGAIALVNILVNERVTPANIRLTIGIGMIFWMIVGACIWCYRGLVINGGSKQKTLRFSLD